MQLPSSRFLKPTLFDRILNRAFGVLIRIGGGLPHNYLLEVRGRKSGHSYTTPVNLLAHNGKEYLVAPRGDTQWVRNVSVSRQAHLIKGFTRKQIRLMEVTDETKPEILKAYLDRYKLTVQRYFPVAAGSDRDAFERLADRFPVFEVDATE